MKVMEIIKRQAIEYPHMPTGVIQDHLMDLGLTLKEADVLIDGWYEAAGLDNEYFDTLNCVGCIACERMKDGRKRNFA